jgi:hypothetical protein
MFDRIREWKLSSPEAIGGGLILVGLVLFLVVFLAVFPVVSDPVGTYDSWFPEEVAADTAVAAEEPEESTPEGPVAAFRFVGEAVVEPAEDGAEEDQPPEFRVTLEDRSEPGDIEINSWLWDLGDGAEADGQSVEHVYRDPGVYPVRLEVTDDNGLSSTVEGEVEIPEEGLASGRFEAESGFDLSGLEGAVEDAVVTLEGSLDDTLESFGSAFRSIAVMVMFALGAIAATVVAWRITRAGVMLLGPAQKMRLNVKSADMHVDVGREAPIGQSEGAMSSANGG